MKLIVNLADRLHVCCQMKFRATPLQPFDCSPVEELKTFLRASHLPVFRSFVTASECPRDLIFQGGMLADPEHPLASEIDVYAFDGSSIETLHVGFQAGAMQQAAPDPIAGKFFRVAHLSLKEPRENDRGENSDYFSDAGAENVIAY
ncbi:hypothetical protein FHT85_002762 [Rhizobium sp. BK312]|nr:hypothetical protein [Rhizobium sp. BK312]